MEQQHKVTYHFKYTNGVEFDISFSSDKDAAAFAQMEGDHLVEYKKKRESFNRR